MKEIREKDPNITEEIEDMEPPCELSEEKIVLESVTQTGYLSPVELILSNRGLVERRETDLEQVKDAIDVLCKIIGFQNLEDVMGDQEELDDRIE